MRWVPHDYQRKAIRFIIDKACAGLFLDPGLGKTSIMLAAFKIMKAKGYVKRMLVITPLRPMQSTWPGEVAKWDEFNGLHLNVLHGPGKELFISDGPAYDIDVINPEGLPWLFSYPMKWWPWDVLCVDESTRFKHTNTQRFHMLKPHLEKFHRRYILTGSPAPNGLLDLFGQIFILDLGHALERFITKYRIKYFNSTGYGGYTWVPKEDSEERIYAKLRPLVLRMDAKDYLQLPPLIYNRVEVELPAAAMKVYRQMEALMVADLAGEKVTAANAAAATMKCRQIANGGIYKAGGTDNGEGSFERVALEIHEAKVDAVEEIVEERQGRPTLVAYAFDHDLARLQRRFGPDIPWIGGGVSGRRFREIEAAWNAGHLPLLFAQPQSVAHGLNLQGTPAHVVEAALTWNLEDRSQFIQRVWRQGQTEPVIVHSIVAKDTVDEVIMRVLGKKDRTQQALLDALKDYGKRRVA